MPTAHNSTGARPRSLPEQARKLMAQFAPEDQVLILIVADPDALASALAMKRILWRRVAGVTIARVNEISRPDNLAMVRLLKIAAKPMASLNPDKFSKRVIVDGQPDHHEALGCCSIHVVIDHHPPGEALKDVAFADVRPKYGSCSTILTEYLQGAKIKISQRLATALTYGIKTDTSSFGRPVVEEDVKAFRALFPHVNQSMLRKIEFSEMRRGDLQVLHQALEDFRISGHTLFAHLGEVKSSDNLVQIADFFLRVDIVDFCTVSGFSADKLVIITRNASPRRNAGKLVQAAFGEIGSAGGHKASARAEVPLEKVDSLLKDLKDKRVADFVMRRIRRAGKKAGGGS